MQVQWQLQRKLTASVYSQFPVWHIHSRKISHTSGENALDLDRELTKTEWLVRCALIRVASTTLPMAACKQYSEVCSNQSCTQHIRNGNTCMQPRQHRPHSCTHSILKYTTLACNRLIQKVLLHCILSQAHVCTPDTLYFTQFTFSNG